MRLSVALCTYNGAAYLQAQLRSIGTQSRPVQEIVLVDDGSTDATLDIAQRLAQELRLALRVFRNERTLGVTKNFERALSLCSGDLIFLCDQDDVWVPEKVARMAAEFEARPALELLFTDALLVGPAGEALQDTLFHGYGFKREEFTAIRQGRAWNTLLRRNLVTGATAALRRRAFERARPFPEQWVHDEWLALMSAAMGEVDYLDLPLTAYRLHGRNQIGIRRNTVRSALRRAAASPGDVFALQVIRAETLLGRLAQTVPLPPEDRLETATAKLAHARIRARIQPAGRLARIVPVLREWYGGGYARYSNGARSVVRDLLAPVVR